MQWLEYQQDDERRELAWELSKMEFLAKLLGSKWRAPRLQEGAGGLGEYCKGQSLEECRNVFGEKLDEICGTCPE